MESRTIRYFGARAAVRCAIALPLLGAVLLAGCSHGVSAENTSVAATALPITGGVEGTKFDPSLEVNLSQFVRRPSGLFVRDLRAGTGEVATPGRTVVVRYIGWLPSGKEFDRGEITVSLGKNQVIRAWEEGVLGMRVGGVRRIVSPAYLAYGAQGAGNGVPPNAVLVFELQLVNVLSS